MSCLFCTVGRSDELGRRFTDRVGDDVAWPVAVQYLGDPAAHVSRLTGRSRGHVHPPQRVTQRVRSSAHEIGTPRRRASTQAHEWGGDQGAQPSGGALSAQELGAVDGMETSRRKFGAIAHVVQPRCSNQQIRIVHRIGNSLRTPGYPRDMFKAAWKVTQVRLSCRFGPRNKVGSDTSTVSSSRRGRRPAATTPSLWSHLRTSAVPRRPSRAPRYSRSQPQPSA